MEMFVHWPNQLVKFTVEGEGAIVGTDNGDQKRTFFIEKNGTQAVLR